LFYVTVMGIPDPGVENYLISNAHARAADLIASFASVQPTDGTELSERISNVLDDYCSALLADLRRAVDRIDAPEATWLRQNYLRLIVDFATGLRDAIADSAMRHAAAQVIQCKVLEHERNLRVALDAHGGLTPQTGDAVEKSAEHVDLKISAN
jgi:hypothetical protein